MIAIQATIRSWLSDLEKPSWRYVFKATPIAFFPAMSLALVLSSFGIYRLEVRADYLGWIFGDALLSPWIETAFMVPVFWFLRKIRVRNDWLPIASAFVWATRHSIYSPWWGLIVFWPFYVFSRCFLGHEGISQNRAFIATSVLHTFYNIMAVLLQLGVGNILL
ncbi:MAG TPA: hypothetical protein PLG56_04260 [Lacunisphaera sp.]|nr:hypothetical protein [Lacunisphaera sp.]